MAVFFNVEPHNFFPNYSSCNLTFHSPTTLALWLTRNIFVSASVSLFKTSEFFWIHSISIMKITPSWNLITFDKLFSIIMEKFLHCLLQSCTVKSFETVTFWECDEECSNRFCKWSRKYLSCFSGLYIETNSFFSLWRVISQITRSRWLLKLKLLRPAYKSFKIKEWTKWNLLKTAFKKFEVIWSV